jgi:hypothetical protein
LEGRQTESFAAEIRTSALIRSGTGCPDPAPAEGEKWQGRFMSWMPGGGGGEGIRSAPGRWLIRAASFVRVYFESGLFSSRVFFVSRGFVGLQAFVVLQAFPAVCGRFEPLRRLAADFSSILSAACAMPIARMAITISIQSRGEWRAKRFNY